MIRLAVQLLTGAVGAGLLTAGVAAFAAGSSVLTVTAGMALAIVGASAMTWAVGLR